MNIYASSKTWDLTDISTGWIGGRFPAPNSSSGYHGILKQFWEAYKPKNSKWLLISETKLAANHFKSLYPDDEFQTLDYHMDESQVDFKYNLCDRQLPNHLPKFDVVVCQATLEHIYDPCAALSNMADISKVGGIICLHTNIPGFPYHPWPTDCLRYHHDWFEQHAKFTVNLELLDLLDFNDGGGHIFALYRKK